ncbi:MAG: RNA-binding S4 domain-containing protein [Ruminococcus sp.]|nr:RNA-binding S4 domain-containing protein [Ruminococcus sp.]
MEDEKKPKRPRIGLSAAPAASADGGEARYDKVNYSGERPAFTPGERPAQPYGQQRPYQPRPYQQRPYQQRAQHDGYQQRPYQPRPYRQREENAAEATEVNTEHTRPNSENAGYQPRQYNNNNRNGYQQRPRPQGGYQQRQYNNQGGYQQRNNQQGGYQQRPQQGGYQQQRPYQQRNNRQGGYQQRPQQGGYQQRNNQQGGYQQRPQQGGYQQHNNQQGGYQQRPQQGGFNKRPGQNRFQPRPGKQFIPRPKQIDYVINDFDPNEPIRLNKFMAGAGVCSRREADEHIVAGLVKVNGEVVTELGTKITAADIVEYDGKVVTPERKCYVLLNKPKDCVTTSDDPNGRTTVLDLVHNACRERIYPVGRLDRNTTGVLLLTNDGDLASKLTHPKYVKKKIYHVWTDKDIAEEDMQRIADGIELEDGEIHADAISYVTDTDKNQAGIEIHSGRNRIVRRIFESLGYRVTKLDRVYFAGLTKKNLPRGRWRYLTQEEVDYLRKGEFE